MTTGIGAYPIGGFYIGEGNPESDGGPVFSSTFLSGLGLPDFLRQFMDLPPPGRAFSRDMDSVRSQVFTPPANALASLHAGAMRLLDREGSPYYAIDLLPEWEAEYGLPDPCSAPNASIPQRRAALLAKIAAIGGQSPEYFISVAAAMGYTITVQEITPLRLGSFRFGDPLAGPGWQYVWRVIVPSITVRSFTLGSSALGDRFATVSASDLQCRLNALKPAHTLLQFVFG